MDSSSTGPPGFAWLDTATAVALVLALGNFPGLLDIKGLWAPAVLGPVGLALLLAGTDELPAGRLERVSVLFCLGVLYGLVTAAPVCWAVAWVPWLVAGVELPYLVVVNAGGIGPLVPVAVRVARWWRARGEAAPGRLSTVGDVRKNRALDRREDR
jgi:hypothetical protein